MALVWKPNHEKLRETLAHLYLDEADALRIAVDAGLDPASLALHSSPENNWHEIIVKADAQGLLSRVIEKACAGRQKNDSLEQLLAYFTEFARAGQKRPGNPYRSMNSFEEAHAEYFFGRDGDIETLGKLVQEKNLLAMTGPSGCGKTSLLQAGLVPELKKRAAWKYARCTPSKIPLDNLVMALKSASANLQYDMAGARANLVGDPKNISFVLKELGLGGPAENFLLLADQFEELFTYREEIDAQDRDVFISALLYAAKVQGVKVIISFRNDFYKFAVDDPKLGPAIVGNIANIFPLNRAGLQQAIEQPAAKTRAVFQEGLVNTILEETLDQPGSLPFLEYTLAELWDKQTPDGMLTLDAYDRIGRVGGAISKKADDQYGGYDDEQKKAFDKIIIRLVRPGDKTDNTRLIAEREDIISDGEKMGVDTWEMVNKLADARLVVINTNEITNQVTVEVAHEALIRSWDHLENLVKADYDFRAWVGKSLKPEYFRWETGSRNPDRLLRGGDLKLAQDWLAKRAIDLGDTERDFVFHSLLHSGESLERWMAFYQPVEDALKFLDGYLAKEDAAERRLAIPALRWLYPQGRKEEILQRLKNCVTSDADALNRSTAAIAIVECGRAEALAGLLADNSATAAGKANIEPIREAIAKARNTPGIGKTVWDALGKKELSEIKLHSVIGLVLDHRDQLAVSIMVPYLVGSYFSLLTSPIWSWLNNMFDRLRNAFSVPSYFQFSVGIGSFDIILIFALLLYFYLRRVYVEQQSIQKKDRWFIVGVSAGIGFLISLFVNSVEVISSIRSMGAMNLLQWAVSFLGAEVSSLVVMYTLIFNLDLEKMNEYNTRKAARLSARSVGYTVPVVILFTLPGLLIDPAHPLFFAALVISAVIFSLLSLTRTFLFVFLSLFSFWLGLGYSFPQMKGQAPAFSSRQVRNLITTLVIIYLVILILALFLAFVPYPLR